MSKNTIKSREENFSSKSNFLNTSEPLDIKSIEKPLNQYEYNGLSASIVTDNESNIISISQSYFKLYGLAPLPNSVSIPEIVSARRDAGWFALSEVFSGQDALETLMHKLKTNQYFRDFHISSTGKIIDVTHFTNLESGTKVFNFTPITTSLAFNPDKSIEINSLMAMHDLVVSGIVDIFPTSLESTLSEKQICALIICAPNSGDIIILDEAKNFPELKNKHHITDFFSDMKDIVYNLDLVGQYSSSVEIEGSEPLQLVLKRHYLYEDGPSFLIGKIVKLWGDITVKSILTQFPIFSLKEAEVICLLSHGYTIKEAAAKTSKAQVTVSLQARSAQHKSGERSINALVARITHSRLW